MSELFGLSMNYIMVGLLVAFGIAIATILWVVLRQRIMFMLGVRNIPRRRAQTVLIVLGLMLSTLIISAAFSIGDTVDYSITNQAYDRLGGIDEIVQAQTGDADDPFSSVSVVSPLPIPERQARDFIEKFRAIDGVDGAVGVIRAPVPVRTDEQSEPIVILAGVMPDGIKGFESDIESVSGKALSLDSLERGEIYANESAADGLDLKRGDALQIFVAGQPNSFTVRDIVKDRVLTGAAFGQTQGLVLPLPRAQELLNRSGEIDLIAISNDGGSRAGLAGTEAVTKALNDTLEGTAWTANETKRDLVDTAAEISSFMTTFFVVLGLFSIAAGMLLIFLIFVMLAAERKGEMGMSRAVGSKRSHIIETFMSEGMAYNLLAAIVGCTLGVAVSLLMVRVMAALFAEFDLSIEFNVSARSLIVSYTLGVVLTFVTVTISSWRISNLNIVRAIRDIPEGGGKRAGRWSLAFGLTGTVAGPLLTWLGLSVDQAFPFMGGITLLTFGVVLTARFLGAPARLLFTAAGVFLIVFWLMGAGNSLPFVPDLNGGIEMFFLSGIAMVTASTFVLVYNADLMLGAIAVLGGRASRVLPSLRTAIAYPMANKFRTGMTIMMISLVVFALVMMSTMNSNFDRIFLSDDAVGGYDVMVDENPSNPVADLPSELANRGFDTGGIAGADEVLVANRAAVQIVQLEGKPVSADDYASYRTLGVSDSFIEQNKVKFQARAVGYSSDEEVWQKVGSDSRYAVIDAFALPQDGFGPGSELTVDGIESTDKVFEPITLEVRNAATGKAQQVEVIGVIGMKASLIFFGLYLNADAFDNVFGDPEFTRHFVRLEGGESARDVARGIERTLLSEGAQADSLRKFIDDQQALSRGFTYLIQSFMGLGLFVGIAAVGVIAFRTVVERRQHIGMLRAIGYSRMQVGLSFVMESSFVTLLGVLSGIGLGLLLANQLVTSDEFTAEGIESFYIPWLQITAIGLFAFVASIVMTIIPSRQAASIPIAEALRYE